MTSSAELETVSGLSRYTPAQHFRACLGTSFYRSLAMQCPDPARALRPGGERLADTAATCSFADQSHVTRHFKRAYGLSPGRWTALCGPRLTH